MSELSVSNRPYFVPRLEVPSSGVDFLGLRQTNLDMMASCLPGINNVTWHVRPFSLIGWVYWEFRNLCAQQGKTETTSADMSAFQEKIESLFTWGAMLDGRSPRVPGKGAVLPATKGEVPLSFEAWQRSIQHTGLMAPVQYGPASKNLGGLGFIEPVRGNLFRTTHAGAELAESFDRAIRQVDFDHVKLIDRLGTQTGNQQLAEKLWHAWNVFEVSEGEQEAFRSVFYSSESVGDYSTDLGKRSSTLDIVLQVLRQAAVPLDTHDIRKAIVHGCFDSGDVIGFNERVHLARWRWSALQVRQLQRLAFEALMSWVEQLIHSNAGCMDADLIVAQGINSIDEKKLADIYDEIFSNAVDADSFFSCGAEDESISLFASMDRLQEAIARGENLLSESIYALILVAVGTKFLAEMNLIDNELAAGGIGRVSLNEWASRFNDIKDLPLSDSLSFIIESLILSQHFATALSRYDGKSQRLRFTIEEEGLTALVPYRWEPHLAQDRLATALSLMSDCNIITKGEEGFSYNA